MSVVLRVTSGTWDSDPGQQFVVSVTVAGPSHPFEDLGRGVLERQVDVAADLLALRHRRQDVVGDRRRVEVEEPDPGQPVNGVELAQQASERSAFAAVDAEERRVLGDEQQLADPTLGERPGLAHDRFAGAAAVRASQRRNDAEGARVVTALGDLDIGKVSRRRQVAGSVGVVEVIGDSGGGERRINDSGIRDRGSRGNSFYERSATSQPPG